MMQTQRKGLHMVFVFSMHRLEKFIQKFAVTKENFFALRKDPYL